MTEAVRRKSNIRQGEIYFWTATIHNWQQLLLSDVYKNCIIDSLQYPNVKSLADVFAFVIMSNHIHLIWRLKALNGKETASGSLLKFTAHTFKKGLQHTAPAELQQYKVTAHNKEYEFWQRDSLTVSLYTKAVAYQKLDYIHFNPITERWRLAAAPVLYPYSSASFYESGERRFSFLKDLRDEF